MQFPMNSAVKVHMNARITGHHLNQVVEDALLIDVVDNVYGVLTMMMYIFRLSSPTYNHHPGRPPCTKALYAIPIFCNRLSQVK